MGRMLAQKSFTDLIFFVLGATRFIKIKKFSLREGGVLTSLGTANYKRSAYYQDILSFTAFKNFFKIKIIVLCFLQKNLKFVLNF